MGGYWSKQMMQKRRFLASDEPPTVPATSPLLRARFGDRGHPVLATAACAVAALICLAALPVAFVAVDHTLVVEWSNAFFDLAGL
jgi:hypothetical protein